MCYHFARRKQLSFPPYERMKALFPGAASVNSERLIKAMEPIIQTASFVIERIIQGGIKISESAGTVAAKLSLYIHVF